jgi:hypothetical protein
MNQDTPAITALRHLIVATSNSDDEGVRKINLFARANQIGLVTLQRLIADAVKRRDQLIKDAAKAEREAGITIVIYEDKYAETDDQRFGYAPRAGVFILCPHAEIIGTMVRGQFTPAAPKGWDVIEA